MFRTFGNTWNLIKISWGVLQKDKELLFFPIMSAIGVAIIAGVTAGIFSQIGTFDRLDSSGQAEINAGDLIIGFAALYLGFFIVMYNNGALIAAARHRLRGGDPNVWTGFAAVNRRLPQLLVWTLIAVIIWMLLQYARSQSRSFITDILIGLVGAAWGYLTFFVLPVLIVEGVGPIEAIKRSGGYFKRTWGEQLVASFGFGIIYILAGIIAAIPIVVLAAISPVAAIVAGVALIGLVFAIVSTLEGIFKAALYEHVAEDVPPDFFPEETLRDAYAPGPTAYRGIEP
ncbi:MAG: DUF6159 family protein [Chloroflexi bacterium]|nr:DUF6159 family protein [Chloroflexota bacterium]